MKHSTLHALLFVTMMAGVVIALTGNTPASAGTDSLTAPVAALQTTAR